MLLLFLKARVRRRLVQWDSPPIDPFDSACHFILKNKKSLIEMSDFSFFKAPIRIELMNKGFADLCLTAWLWRRQQMVLYHSGKVMSIGF